MPNGLSQEQMTERMFTELVGLDGQSGMKKDLEDVKERQGEGFADARNSRKSIHEKIENVETKMMTKSECKNIRKADKERKEWNWKKRMGYFALQVSVMTLLIAVLGIIAKAAGLW